jgi:hypothetical protein
MKTEKKIISAIVAVILCVGLTILGCNQNDSTTSPTVTTLHAPTGLMAYSASATSVTLQWTLSTSESDAEFTNYVVNAKDPSGIVAVSLNVPKGTPNVTVTPLVEGIIYTFVVRAAGTDGTVSSDSASIRWSPARRYPTDSTNGPPIQVYDLHSTLGASGLQFGSSGGYAKVRSLSVDNPDRILCDIYVDSTGGGSLCLKNIALLAGYPKNTYFSTNTRDAVDLNDLQIVPPDSTSYQLNRVDIPTSTVTQSKILYARSMTSNKYIRILVQRNPGTGYLYYGSGSDRYVVLQLSYQNAVGNPYARTSSVTSKTR